MKRPELNDQISVDDFRNFYWLKEELAAFCKIKGISTQGGKIELADRIAAFLSTGKVAKEPIKLGKRVRSSFDWSKETLHLTTVITDSYKSSEQVRAFFTEQIGAHFRFTVDFMKWMKENEGKTLRAAIDEWNRLYELSKDKNYQTEIAPQFEYNRYMRDFLADNPGLGSKDAMAFWKIKRSLPGNNVYAKTDLLLKANE